MLVALLKWVVAVVLPNLNLACPPMVDEAAGLPFDVAELAGWAEGTSLHWEVSSGYPQNLRIVP